MVIAGRTLYRLANVSRFAIGDGDVFSKVAGEDVIVVFLHLAFE